MSTRKPSVAKSYAGGLKVVKNDKKTEHDIVEINN